MLATSIQRWKLNLNVTGPARGPSLSSDETPTPVGRDVLFGGEARRGGRCRRMGRPTSGCQTGPFAVADHRDRGGIIAENVRRPALFLAQGESHFRFHDDQAEYLPLLGPTQPYEKRECLSSNSQYGSGAPPVAPAGSPLPSVAGGRAAGSGDCAKWPPSEDHLPQSVLETFDPNHKMQWLGSKDPNSDPARARGRLPVHRRAGVAPHRKRPAHRRSGLPSAQAQGTPQCAGAGYSAVRRRRVLRSARATRRPATRLRPGGHPVPRACTPFGRRCRQAEHDRPRVRAECHTCA